MIVAVGGALSPVPKVIVPPSVLAVPLPVTDSVRVCDRLEYRSHRLLVSMVIVSETLVLGAERHPSAQNASRYWLRLSG